MPPETDINKAVLSTLSFFNLFSVPLTAEQVFLYLYKQSAGLSQVKDALIFLASQNKIFSKNEMYALTPWADGLPEQRSREYEKRIKKVKKFLWLLALVPFVREMSLINSMAMGNVKEESDIDLFVITAPNFVYFARTIIFLIFRLLGAYKTKNKIKERFCFGFYVSASDLDLQKILIKPEDPYTAFWLASMQPLFGKKNYVKLVCSNPWVFEYLPNFTPTPHFYGLVHQPMSLYLKPLLEVVFFLPALLLEPVLRKIHITHTFNLPENHWATATTIANKYMLKLHALDPRSKIRAGFFKSLEAL